MSKPQLRSRRLLGPRTLVYFYRRRLRAHGAQEAFAAVGIAAAVALTLAAGISQSSIAASTKRVLRAVIGPAQLQLRARSPQGFSEGELARVEAIGGIVRAAPLLERAVRVLGASGRQTSVYVAGTDVSLGVLNGLGRTLPLAAYHPDTIALSAASAGALRIDPRAPGYVSVLTGGLARRMRVSAVLGGETVGVLASSQLAVMPLASMQSMLGEPGRVSRILIQTRPGREQAVAAALTRIGGGSLNVQGTEQDVDELRQALGPSEQASALFAAIGALLGFLLAFNAILLTIPERRQAIADLRLSGTTRSAIAQLVLFQACCLGLFASAVGVGIGYALSRLVLHESTGYLAEAFALSGGTIVPAWMVAAAAGAGVLVTCVASTVPMVDLRASRPADLIYVHGGVPGNALGRRAQRRYAAAALALLALASVLYAAVPADALAASVALALATVLAVPSAFSALLACARHVSERAPRLPTLALALAGVRATTLRSVALAATGAVALFGSIALGGARSDLLTGIRSFARSYAADAPVWVGEPDDNQATGLLRDGELAPRLRRLPGVAGVHALYGGFLAIGSRRVWVIARPPGGADSVLATQTIGGPQAASAAARRLGEGGWVALSEQLARALHSHVGGRVTLPTPAGVRTYRLAALTTNLAWIPGVLFMDAADYRSAWGSSAPSALAVFPTAGVSARTLRDRIARTVAADPGIEVATAQAREGEINVLTGEGLSQLGIVSTLLVIAAIVALAAALGSSIAQRRHAMASLRLAGAPPSRLRRILFAESSLMLGAGCLAGVLAGIYGQFVIDAYLRHVTGFPVAGVGTNARPLVLLALVLAAALAAVALPAWLVSTVPPALALAEE
jgi:putative ABC transport system permease protein